MINNFTGKNEVKQECEELGAGNNECLVFPGRGEAEEVRGAGGLRARVWGRRQDLLLAPRQRRAARPTDRPLRRPQVVYRQSK